MTKWQIIDLHSKITIRHGFPFKSEFFSDQQTDYIVLTPGNFQEEGGFKRQVGKEKFYTGEIPEDYLHKKGDLIVAMTEQAAGLLGSCARVPVSGGYLHNQRLGLINAKSGEISLEYVYHLFKTKSVREQIKASSSGSKVKHTSPERIYDVKVPLPSLAEQQNIAKILDTIEEKIELNNKINVELEAMAKLIYDYWFVQFDFPDANGKPYKSSGGKMVYNEELKREIPDGWDVDIINNVINVKDGTHDSPQSKDTGYPLITSKHLKPEGLDFAAANLISEEDYVSVNKRSKVDTGDILFSMIGSIGEIYKVDEQDINFAIKNVALYKSSKKPEYINFIYMFLRSYDMQRYMGNVTSGSIQKFIGLGALRTMPILINDEMIMKFVKTTEHLFQKKTLIKLENQKLTQLRYWLLPMLMNGQVSIKQ
jgi:type I restriction enzyme S subunit